MSLNEMCLPDLTTHLYPAICLGALDRSVFIQNGLYILLVGLIIPCYQTISTSSTQLFVFMIAPAASLRTSKSRMRAQVRTFIEELDANSCRRV